MFSVAAAAQAGQQQSLYLHRSLLLSARSCYCRSLWHAVAAIVSHSMWHAVTLALITLASASNKDRLSIQS